MGMTYTLLKANIQDICETTFTDAQLLMFVSQAETIIYNAAQIVAGRKTSTLTTTLNDPYLLAPTDFLYVDSLASVSGTTHTPMVPKEASFMREAFPSTASTGVPRYYALDGLDQATPSVKRLRFILGPTPNAALSIALNYNYYPESITTVSGGETWLGNFFDTALLNGALVEAIRFQKGEADLVTLYDTRFKESLALFKAFTEGHQKADVYRNGEQRATK